MKERHLRQAIRLMEVLTDIEGVDQKINIENVDVDLLTVTMLNDDLSKAIIEVSDFLNLMQERSGELYNLKWDLINSGHTVPGGSIPAPKPEVRGVDECGDAYDIEPVQNMGDLQ